jgi:hypothetical protein
VCLAGLNRMPFSGRGFFGKGAGLFPKNLYLKAAPGNPCEVAVLEKIYFLLTL